MTERSRTGIYWNLTIFGPNQETPRPYVEIGMAQKANKLVASRTAELLCPRNPDYLLWMLAAHILLTIS
jgi:hypothetical protein